MMGNKLKCLSLFSNVGVAEAYFEEIGVDVVLANELEPERARFYKHLYPNTEMVNGDITDESVRDYIVNQANQLNVNLLIATPPCQGMSRHGKRDPFDARNQLISYAIDVIKRVEPNYVMLENVPKQLTTKIDINGKRVLIPEYIKSELGNLYKIKEYVLNTADFGVPQSRMRSIYLMTKKNINVVWENDNLPIKHVTLREAIGHLPDLDPLVREESERWRFPDFEKKKNEALKISKWHYPPIHSWRHINWMMHTPSGKTAFENDIYYPQKEHGVRISGRISTYKRFGWDKPANTITQNNGVISSAICVHPGREVTNDGTEEGRIYSDARVLTIYELLIVSSIPVTWNIPEWASDKFIRNVIGEGIPPLMTKKLLLSLIANIKSN